MTKTESLAIQVVRRKKLVTKIVQFVEKFIVKVGKIVKREIHPSNINTVWELAGFKNFSFQFDSGQSMMGGNDVTIWYTDPVTQRYLVVFSFRYQCSIDEGTVLIFNKEIDWLTPFLKIVRNQNKLVSKIEKQKKQSELNKLKASREHDRLKFLKNEASRLGL